MIIDHVRRSVRDTKVERDGERGRGEVDPAELVEVTVVALPGPAPGCCLDWDPWSPVIVEVAEGTIPEASWSPSSVPDVAAERMRPGDFTVVGVIVGPTSR
jgi:hypothetical protein